ncbi:CHAT domain-containing protein [Streptomyces sp. NPDC058737]|uniref:CHAT domain-containing protein n=1 Tax=Streptomyces sp. NPDC058737 TaxID=3346617 RepID=UPI003687EAB9
MDEVTSTGDSSAVLAAAARSEARRLAEQVEGEFDVEAAYALGWLHYLRSEALPDATAGRDLEDALQFFTGCFIAGWNDLPRPLLAALAERAVPAGMDGLDYASQAIADPAFLTSLVALWRRIAENIPAGAPEWPRAQANLGAALQRRFALLGEAADADEAVNAIDAAVRGTPDDHPYYGMLLSDLAVALVGRFECFGAPRDQDDAVDAARASVQATPDDSPHRAMHLGTLASALRVRFDRTAEAADLEQAVEVSRAAVRAVPADHPDRAEYLNFLIRNLRSRFRRMQDLEDLREAVEMGREAVRCTDSRDPAHAYSLHILGCTLQELFERTEDLTDLDEAIEAARAAVHAALTDPLRRAAYLNNLGAVLQMRFECTGELSALDEAVEAGREAVRVTPGDHSDRADYLSNVAIALRRRFECSRVPADLDEAVEAGRSAVRAARDAHPNYRIHQANLGVTLLARVTHTGDSTGLDEAVEAIRAAMPSTPGGDPVTTAEAHGYLGQALLRRHQFHGRPEDLEGALAELREAHQGLEPLGPDHPKWPAPTRNLGAALLLAGRHAEAAAVFRRVVTVQSQGSPEAAETHLMLGSACRAMYLRHRRRQDLDDCLLSLWAAHSTSSSAPGAVRMRADVAQLLAAALLDLYDVDREGRYLEEAARTVRECLEREDRTEARMRLLVRRAEVHYAAYHHTGNRDELDAVIATADEILLEAAADAEASLSAPWESAIGPTLARALCDRFRLEPDRRDLDLAVETAQDVLERSAEEGRNAADHASQLLVLGYALTLRGEAFGSPTDADHAVECLTEALDLLPADSPQRCRAHAELGNAFRARAAISGDTGDLDAAVAAYREAVAADTDHFTLAGFATARLARFLRRGGRADLDEAITLSRAAAQTAPDHERHTALHLAGNALRLRFVHFGDQRDLEEAIDTGEQAVRAIPPRHAERPAYLSNLALAHGSRFRELGPRPDLDGLPGRSADETDGLTPLLTYDIDRSIDLLREAVDTVPVGHRYRPGLLANLADALAARFEAAPRGADRHAALTKVADALDECPAGRPERAQLLHVRARLLLGGAAVGSATAADRSAASEALREAAEAATASPLLRMTALRELALRTPDPAAASAAYEQAMACVPLVAWHGLSRRDRERHLTHVGPLTQEAAAAALDSGRPERAVELLEHGRAILWSQSLDTDPDVDAVRRTAPELADRLDEVRARLLALDAGQVGLNAAVERTDQRMNLAREWDALCEQVRRQVPGCRDFLRPPGFAQLRTAAANGTVVLINTAERRSDALALSPDGLTVIPLPQLSPRIVQQHVTTYMSALESYEYTDLLSAIDERYVEGQLDQLGFMMQDVLNWLWDAAVEPVLDALGHTSEPTDGAWPRVWWCPAGPLTFLPFHAAGRYRPESPAGACVLDRVVSSYTPTLRSLIQARTRPSPETGSRRMLVVAMPETPGLPPLPDAEEDVEAVTACFPGRTSVIVGPEATRDAVRRALGEHSWAHFSCHGDLDPHAPSHSGLRLHDGTLTVADLGRLRLEHADFAFLSSCKTALTGFGLPDEALHISAALQFAGYRHVVATMWTTLGRYASLVADHLYDFLAGNGEPASEECALALHHAVREVRAQPGMELVIWTPFIHTGP